MEDTNLEDILYYFHVEYGFIYYALSDARIISVLTYPIDVKHTLVC